MLLQKGLNCTVSKHFSTIQAEAKKITEIIDYE